jgi:hypothetical protein
MASDHVTPSIKQRCIIKFLVKEKVKPADILHKLNAQYGEKTLSRASVYDWYDKFSEGREEVQDTAVSWQDHGKCVLEFRRGDSC